MAENVLLPEPRQEKGKNRYTVTGVVATFGAYMWLLCASGGDLHDEQGWCRERLSLMPVSRFPLAEHVLNLT